MVGLFKNLDWTFYYNLLCLFVYLNGLLLLIAITNAQDKKNYLSI